MALDRDVTAERSTQMQPQKRLMRALPRLSPQSSCGCALRSDVRFRATARLSFPVKVSGPQTGYPRRIVQRSLQGGRMSTASPALSFPQETAEYRKARNELLTAEIELRRQIEAIAAARRKLPLGGQVAQDYVFDEGPTDLSEQGVRQTPLSELFDPGKDSFLVYSYMY